MTGRQAPDQVIAKVRQGQKMLNDGHPMIEVIKELQITEATWYRWLTNTDPKKTPKPANAPKSWKRKMPASRSC